MCKLNNCCCCLDLRTGTIAISLSIIVLAIANITLRFVLYDTDEMHPLTIVNIIVWFIVRLAIGILLLVGAVMKTRRVVFSGFIGLVLHTAVLIWEFIDLVVTVAVVSGTNTWVWDLPGFAALTVIYLILIIIEIGLSIYSALVIWSFCRGLRGGQSGAILL